MRAQPRALLAAIPGLELREIADPEICCGSAGVYNLLNPEPARELGDRKARNVLATGADLLVTANPGCLMQVAASARRLGRDRCAGPHRRGARRLDPRTRAQLAGGARPARSDRHHKR